MRWWDSAEQARAALDRIDDSDPAMGVGTALLAYHAIAKEALEPLSGQTLVDQSLIEAFLDGVDLAPVAEAISKAVSGGMTPDVAKSYGVLMTMDTHTRAVTAAKRLATALVAKGQPWPTAVAKSISVVGVPLERLGRYPEEVTKAGVNDLGVADAGDRALMTWVSAVSKSLPFGVSKAAGRERPRPDKEQEHQQEHIRFDENEVERDEKGRFAPEGNEAARKARQARKARRNKRRARQMAMAAADKEKEAAKEKTTGAKSGTRAPQLRGAGMRQARIRGPQLRSQAKLRELAAQQEGKENELLELKEKKKAEETPLEGEVTGAFDLPIRSLGGFEWLHGGAAPVWSSLFTMEPVDLIGHESVEVFTGEDVFEFLGGETAFNGPTEYSYSMEGRQQLLGIPDRTDADDPIAWGRALGKAWWERKDEFPAATAENYDPDTMFRTLKMSPDDIKNAPTFIGHGYHGLPVKKEGTGFVNANLSDLPDGSSWSTVVEDEVNEQMRSVAVTLPRAKGEDEIAVVYIPMIRQQHIANSKVWKAAAGRERPRDDRPGKENTAGREWKEAEVKRDAQGQFAPEAGAEAAQRRQERLARKKRRTKRRARAAAWQARDAEAAKPKAAEPKLRGAQIRSAKTRERTGRFRQPKSRDAMARASAPRLRPRTLVEDEKPIGLTAYSRATAPTVGAYTLDEPLYSFSPVDPHVPTMLMTEDQLTATLRMKITTNVQRKRTVDAHGERTDSWPNAHAHSHVDEVYRYEARTIALGGKSPTGTFHSAVVSDLNQSFDQEPFTGEEPSEWTFPTGAPGEKFNRTAKTTTVRVVPMFTNYSLSKAGGRERTREAGREREQFREEEVKRDEKGRFAPEDDEAKKKAREARKARKRRRKARAARAAAWNEREKSPEKAKEAAPKLREAQLRQANAMRAAKAKESEARLRPAEGRKASLRTKEAMRAHGKANEAGIDWTDALFMPGNTHLGEFLGQAGYMPWSSKLPWDALNYWAPKSGMKLQEGESVQVSDLLKEMGDSSSGGSLGSNFAAVLRPMAKDVEANIDRLAANDMTRSLDNIEHTTRMILSHALDTWTPPGPSATGKNLLGHPVGHSSGDVPRWMPENGQATVLEPGGTISVVESADDDNKEFQPIVIGNQAAIALRQMNAMLSFTTDESTSRAQLDLAMKGWRRVHGRDGKSIVDQSSKKIMKAVAELADEADLAIHPITDDALIETAELAMSKQKAPAVRLDNRGVFLITSRLDTKNGWDTWREKNEKELNR